MTFLIPLLAAALARPCAAAGASMEVDHVVLIVVDALRQDRLGVYGNRRATSPNLDALARDGALFMNVEAQSNWTLPALASIMTSLYPAVHGAVRRPVDRHSSPGRSLNSIASVRLDESRPTLAETLREAGWTTAGIVSGDFCRSEFGFDHGFQSYQNTHAKLEELNDRYVLPWIKSHQREKFFLYVHAFDVHAPYDTTPRYNHLWDPDYRGAVDGSVVTLTHIDEGRVQLPERDLRHLLALYDGGVSYEDAQIARIIDELKSLGLDRRTLIIITADHGESFHEHGTIMQHGRSAYETELRVPLIMKVPGRKPGARVESVIQAIDIAPTVLDAIGVAAPPVFQGRSALGLLDGDPSTAGREEPAFSQAADFSKRKTDAAVREGRWKLIRHEDGTPLEELYDLSSDPGEKTDLARENPEIVARLNRDLDEWDARNAATAASLPRPAFDAPISRDTAAKLRAAGYIK